MPSGKTPILQSNQMAEGDNNKHVIFNDAIVALEDSQNRKLALDTSGGSLTLTESQFLDYSFIATSGHAVPITITVPTTVGAAVPTNRYFSIRNGGTDTVTVTHGGGATVVIEVGESSIVHADGTDIIAVGGSDGNPVVAVEDEGISILSQASILNFVGAGVTVTDAGGGEATITISGGGGVGGSIEIQEEDVQVQDVASTLNFEGDAITAAADGAGKATVTSNYETGAAIVTKIDTELGGTTWQGGGASTVNGEGFRVEASAGTAAGTNTVVDFDSEVHDPENVFNTTTNRFTVPASWNGKLIILSCGVWENDFDNVGITLQIRKNGTTFVVGHEGSTTCSALTTSTVVLGATNDYYEVTLTGSGFTTAAEKRTFFAGVVVG